MPGQKTYIYNPVINLPLYNVLLNEAYIETRFQCRAMAKITINYEYCIIAVLFFVKLIYA